MSLEANLKAALAANDIVKNELRIRSSNRPADNAVPNDFMNEMTDRRGSLRAGVFAARSSRKRILCRPKSTS